MVTPLLDILQLVLSRGGQVNEALLAEHGYAEIDGPDVQEAILALAETMPIQDSMRLVEAADALNLEGPLGLEGAAEALREAQATYESIVEAETEIDTDLDGSFVAAEADSEDDADLDLDIDTELDEDLDTDDSSESSDSSSVSVSVNVSGDDDPDIDVDVSGDSDPSVEIVVNDEEVDLDEDGSFLGDLGESEEPTEPEVDHDFELGFD